VEDKMDWDFAHLT